MVGEKRVVRTKVGGYVVLFYSSLLSQILASDHGPFYGVETSVLRPAYNTYSATLSRFEPTKNREMAISVTYGFTDQSNPTEAPEFNTQLRTFATDIEYRYYMGRYKYRSGGFYVSTFVRYLRAEGRLDDSSEMAVDNRGALGVGVGYRWVGEKWYGGFGLGYGKYFDRPIDFEADPSASTNPIFPHPVVASSSLSRFLVNNMLTIGYRF